MICSHSQERNRMHGALIISARSCSTTARRPTNWEHENALAQQIDRRRQSRPERGAQDADRSGWELLIRQSDIRKEDDRKRRPCHGKKMALPGLEIVDETLEDALGDNVAPFVSSAVKLSENRFKLRQFYVIQHVPGPKKKTQLVKF